MKTHKRGVLLSFKVPRDQRELAVLFNEHLDFLRSSAAAYDAGKFHESKRIAASIRLLVHDTSQSKSLLLQLGRKSEKFLNTSVPINENELTSQSGLTVTMIGAGEASMHYHPMLDDSYGSTKLVDFNEWWEGIVFVDQLKNKFSRQDLILKMANEDGGSHVDPGLTEKYHKLTRENSMGGLITDQDGQWKAIEGPERAAIRQIGHEFLKTFDASYAPPVTPKEGVTLGNVSISFSGPKAVEKHSTKVGRNDKCPCGSGKKYKKCCLLRSS